MKFNYSTLLSFCFLFFFSSSYGQFIDTSAETIIDAADQLNFTLFSTHGDLDNDGDIDVLTTDADGKIVWFENLDGNGNYSQQKFIDISIPSPYPSPTECVIADMNNDGLNDFLVLEETTSSIYLYQNMGQGVFEESTLFNYDNSIITFVVGDVNDDGNLDVIITPYVTVFSMILLKAIDGNANFADAEVITENPGRLVQLKLTDLDNDGDLDLAVCGNEKLGWYENTDGQGSFGPVNNLWNNWYGDIHSIETADLNGDGLIDILFAPEENFGTSVWLPNLGNGQFGDFTDIVGSENGNYLHCADLDNDGDSDIIISQHRHGFVVYHNSDGQGTFVLHDAFLTTDEDESYDWNLQVPIVLATADMDSDGDLDILQNYYGLNTKIGWHRYDEDAETYSQFEMLNRGIHDLRQMKLSDLDNDGDKDILTASFIDDRIGIFTNTGQGVFEDQISVTTNANGIIDVVPFDIDNDGDQDVLSICQYNKNISWYENMGDNTFSLAHIISTDIEGATAVICEDIDNDGFQDVVVGNEVGRVYWFSNLQGSGDFSASVNIFEESHPVKYLSTADIDNDGDEDLLIIDENSSFSNLYFYKNEGGVFSFHLEKQSLGISIIVRTGDIDMDGNVDLVMARGLSSGTLAWYRNIDGQGNFPQLTAIDVEAGNRLYHDMEVIDLNMDGELDIVGVKNYYSTQSRLTWYEGLGAGEFSEEQVIVHYDEAIFDYIDVDDMDNDLDMDILVGSTERKEILWYQNVLGNAPISGYFFYDENLNQIRDTNEIGLSNQTIEISPSPVFSYPDNQGKFRFYVSEGAHTLQALPAENWELTTSSSISLDYQGTPLTNVDFGFTPTTIISEISPDITSAATRCSFHVPFWLKYQNTGTTLENGYLKFTPTEGSIVHDYSPAPDTIINDTLFWNFVEIAPSVQEDIYLVLEMPDASNLGDTLNFNATSYLIDSAGDTTLNTSYIYEPILNCAYDPNDKNVEPKGIGEDFRTPFGTQLEYTIRFQNTGTDTAFTVRLEDFLDTDLAWTSLKPVAASHPYTMTLDVQTGLLTFLFEDILLPDSTTNEVQSHGFVKYKISPKSNLDEGTQITNEASIFFDFNPPILTNTVLNTLLSDINTYNPGENPITEVSVNPNPFSVITRIEIGEIPGNIGTLFIYDISGKLIFRQETTSNTTVDFRGDNLFAGAYFYELKNKGNQRLTTGIILKQ